MITLSFQFATLDEAQAFMADCGAEGEASTGDATVTPIGKKRGRPAKAAAETAVASSEAPKGHMTKMVEETKAANAAASTTTKEQLFAAATKLIETKGEEFASAFLAEKFAPHARFSEIPAARWGELVAAVDAALAAKASLI